MKFNEILLSTRAHRKIMIDEVFLDMCENWNAAILLTRLVYWYLPDQNGSSKLRVFDKDGEWIAKSYKDIQKETRLTEYQVRDALKVLSEKKLINKKIKKFNAIPTLHLQINKANFEQAYKEVIEIYQKELNSQKKNKIDENEESECMKPTNRFVENIQNDSLETYESITIEYKQKNTNNNNNNSLEEQSLEVESKELVVSDNTDSILEAISKNHKPNLVYQIYLLYIKNWTKRYKGLKEPILTKKMAGQIKLLLRDIQNIDEIDKMLEAFISCDEGYLISKTHDFGLFLCDLNKWLALSDKPELAKVFTTEYAKNKMYLQKKELVQKEEEKKREIEFLKKKEEEKEFLEKCKQEEEKRKKEEQERMQKEAEEKRKREEQLAKEMLDSLKESGWNLKKS